MNQESPSTDSKAEEFQAFSDQMQSALDNEDVTLFSSLVRKRSKMMHSLFESGTTTPSAELLVKLTEENRRWIACAQKFLKQTQAKIDKLKPLKTATRHISNAYSAQGMKPGNLLSRKG